MLDLYVNTHLIQNVDRKPQEVKRKKNVMSPELSPGGCHFNVNPSTQHFFTFLDHDSILHTNSEQV